MNEPVRFGENTLLYEMGLRTWFLRFESGNAVSGVGAWRNIERGLGL